ncbi:pre-toxin TG domain-containing protein [Paenibacillus glycanilyticus]|uniref:pre-toxin TG domain-containing protein n=1 Tax=Paenibacillus glycanilyticus TaxID=126569 RepID=UPI00255A2F8B
MSRDGDSIWLQGGDFLLDVVPFVGTVKGFQQAFTGMNYVTGERLSVADRWAEGIGATLSVVPIPGLKYLGKYGTSEIIDASRGLAKGTNLDFINETGRLGGNLYTKKDLKLLGNYLGRRGVSLKVGDEYLPPGKGGGFNYITDELVLRSNPTQYEVWHELSHYIQYKQIGKDAYTNLPRTKGEVPMNDLSKFNAPEQFVFDMLSNSERRWNLLNAEEKQHAIDYIMEYGGIR